MKLWAAIGLLLIQACASGPRFWSPEHRLSPLSCAAPGDSVSAPWQLVKATGFTFCVPSDWRPSGEHLWLAVHDSIIWGTGQAPPQMVPGIVLDAPVAQSHVLGVPVCRSQAYVGTIDRNHVGMSDTECPDTHYTYAQFSAPAVFLLGRAKTARAASLELAIYRTVRFSSSRAETGTVPAPPPN